MEAVAEKYQVMPPLTEEEFEALKADIAERGVQVPVEYDEEGNVLDGYHRARACAELGITDWPKVVRQGLTEAEKWAHALALNLDRRHLTREQRRELVADLRGRGWSLRRIAVQLGFSHEAVRKDLSGVNNLTPEWVVGADGKAYRSDRPNTVYHVREAEAPAPVQPAPAKEWAAEDEAPAVESVSLRDGENPVAVPGARPHISNNSGNNEWYTPAEYIEAARNVMGGIDLDPASSAKANEVVGAIRFYTSEDDGLEQRWEGRVFLNPPYAQPLIAQFCERLAYHTGNGTVTEACVLVNNATETAWFQLLAQAASAICFPRSRVRFWAPGRIAAPLQGQAVLYIGPNVAKFTEEFAPFGVVMRA